ncbi:MAG: sigma-54 dependent transcriptional regulator [Rhizobiaceae bacterium]|nr:sigma-54 dependent transcriptional regulator [Rhizobiaceae bacterium]
MSELVLVVDDDPVQRRLLEGILGKLGYKTLSVDGGQAALDALSSEKGKKIKAVILDLVMPEVDGTAVLNAMAVEKLPQPVIVQTAQGGVETAVNAMRAGAVDFVVKPASPQRLKVSLQNALKMGALTGEIKRITKKRMGKLTVKEIISSSPSMEAVKQIVSKAAQSNIPVLIEGESGVGKEMIARAIQGMSGRSDQNLVTVNCGALPENLVESILFGHEKGAFTGASDKHIGKFQEAHGGTLFLDEVGELPLDIQVKLLRAIQEGEIDPVGSVKPVKVDIRLISATNKNLLDEVRNGNFREDLYYRLSVFPMTLPPLRDRKEDIPELVRHFIARFAAEEGRKINGISTEALEMVCEYHWPGNIRQLENTIFRAVVLSETDELTVDEFPQLQTHVKNSIISLPRVSNVPSMTTPMPNGKQGVHSSSLGADEGLGLLTFEGEVISLEEAESRVIEFAMDRYDGKMSEIARRLGIGRSTLYRKMRHYGLESDDAAEE